MKANLVIVESPSKAKTIEKYLGKEYVVRASVGHIKDLPTKRLGVAVEQDFAPEYEVIKGKKKVIDELKKIAREAESVYLAPDPDREGEAIAWHVAEELQLLKNPPKIHRVLFNEITKKAIVEAMQHPTVLDRNMFEAQQARRILDRLVGYQISPLLWDKVRRGLSAGRVQSVAVRLVCEREAEIAQFKSEEYWSIRVLLEGSKAPSFWAKFHKSHDKKVDVKNAAEAQGIVQDLSSQAHVLTRIERKEQRRHPSPPFITSKLQQEASRKLGFTAKKTMMIAQKLYEGKELGNETVGLITYMRTDSTRIAPSAIQEVRAYIETQFGKEYLPEKPNFYKSKKGAQDAHEAIRPTSMQYEPGTIKDYLSRDEFRLYELIWKRFVASQMSSAIFDRTTFIIMCGHHELRATGSVMRFRGFIAVYLEGVDEMPNQEDEEGEGNILPDLNENETLKAHEFLPEQHFTQPPPRYSEATLVKELEEKGIGRPSTYASILSVIQDKEYVKKNDQKKFYPTDLGKIINELLVHNFPNIIDVGFTAKMEEELDEVEEGKIPWVRALHDFYGPFAKTLAQAKVAMRDVKRQEIETEIICEKCQLKMIIKFGRHGEFLACKGYPECTNTKEFMRKDTGQIVIREEEKTEQNCDKCGSPMVVKRGRFGRFIACSTYPGCKNTKPFTIGVNCPECASPLAEKQSKRGKIFYGCTGYPKCSFASWDQPVNEPCPQCGAKILVLKVGKQTGGQVKCISKGCGYHREVADHG